jgi:hypothetical protein
MELNLQRYTVDAKAAHEVVVMPHFGDVIGENGEVIIPSDETGDWTVLDDVPHSRDLIQIFGNKNLLKRRDATCKVIRSSLGTATSREIFTRKVYIAAENCQQELYQGAFRHWESQQDIFEEKALDIIGKAFGTDSFTNKWFGKESRANNATYSLNKFNGIFNHLNKAISSTLIPAAQTATIPAGEISEADAYDLIIDLIEKQDEVLYNMDDDDKAVYLDKKLAKKVWRYLVSVGQATPTGKAEAMPKTFFVEDIELRPKKWNPVLANIVGATHAYAAVLTVKGNFVFATDKKYGKGPNNEGPALAVWYDQDEDVTKWDLHVKAGTEMIAPQHSTVALTDGLTALL